MELYNVEAEEAIIGICLGYGNKIDSIIAAIRPNEFYKERNKIIFKAIVEMFGRRETIDLITLSDTLRREKTLDMIGSSAEISRISSLLASGSNWQHYAGIVREMSQRRSIQAVSRSLIEKAQLASESVESLMSFADSAFLEIAERKDSGYKHISEYAVEVLAELEEDYKRKGKLKGIPTGLPELDTMTCGLQPTNFVVIGARPSVGKSSIEVQMMLEAALIDNRKVGFFSAEMKASKLIRRMLSNITEVSGTAMNKGMLTQSQFADINAGMERLFSKNIYMNDTSNIHISELESEMRRMKKNHKIDIAFIDYLGIIRHNEKGDRWKLMLDISQRLKKLARELDIPVVCAAQLGREADNQEPNLSNIKESSQIEADADIIMFLHRDGAQDQIEEKLKLIVAKNREGAVGRFEVIHKKAFGKMIEVSKQS
jgi:replicative DNA helicase